MAFLVALSLLLAFIALVRANEAQKEARQLRERLGRLERWLSTQSRLPQQAGQALGQSAEAPESPALPATTQAGATPSGSNVPPVGQGVQPVSPVQPASPDAPPRAPVPQPLPVWPEDVPLEPQAPAPPAAARQRPVRSEALEIGLSRARISVVGGVLVLGGLAWTLRALGLPAWPLLLGVFGFAALLYTTARLTPWPVSGALRGLGYGAAALGLGSLSQKFPGWGPGMVMAGLLALSGALAWDALRRRELLLGALAVSGAGLSVWMLADDLGRWSVLALGGALVLAGAGLLGWRTLPAAPTGPAAEQGADCPESRLRALTLTLGAAGLLPLGWLVASAAHALPKSWTAVDRSLLAEVMMVQSPDALGVWLGLSLLALLPVAALFQVRGTPAELDHPWVRLSGVWAALTPQLLTALAVGAAVRPEPGQAALWALGIAALLLAAAAWAWRQVARTTRQTEEPEQHLAGALAGALSAGASGVLGALALALLGARTEPLALGGVAFGLLLLGLHGHSRWWVRSGLLGLGAVALWGASEVTGFRQASVPEAVLGALPALLAWTGTLRLAQSSWALTPRSRLVEGQPAPPEPPTLHLWVAGVAGVAVPAALNQPNTLLWAALGAAGLALSVPRWAAALRGPVQAAALPALLLGTTLLLSRSGASLPFQAGAVAAALALLWAARLTLTVRPLLEGTALVFLVLGLGELTSPVVRSPVLALTLGGVLAALWPLRLPPLRVDVLLGLAAGAGLLSLAGFYGPWEERAPFEAAALVLTLLVWAGLRTPAGQRGWAARVPGVPPPLPAPHRAAWLGGLLVLAVSGLGHLQAEPNWTRTFSLLASFSLLGAGLYACLRLRVRDMGVKPHEGAALWWTGMGLMALAGFKAAALDAWAFGNPALVVGLSVLLTGLTLLLVAVLAPRPRPGPARAEGPQSESSPVPPEPR